MFIAAVLEPEALGIFAVAIAWANVIRIIPRAVGQVLFPRVSAALTVQEQTLEISRATRLVILLLFGFCGVSLGLAPFAIPFLFGNDFLPAIPVAMFIVIAIGLSGVKRLLSEGLRGLGKPQMVLMGELAGVCITAVCLPLLLGPLKVIGAAVAILIGEISATLLLIVFTTRFLEISVHQLLIPGVVDLQSIFLVLRKAWETVK
jgi:O-antigen/teichoic acid export membrane protein